MKTVVVTGANRGIGLEFCRQFKEKGDIVIALCRKSSPELVQLGIEIYENIDFRSSDEIKSCVKTLQGIAVDLLINNAGVLYNESIGSLNFETIKEQWEVNALGPLRVTDAFLPLLSSGSKIVMVTSRMGSIEDNTSGAYYGYRASKSALNMFSKSLSIDLKEKGISLIILHPGHVQTDMTAHQGDMTPKESVQGMMRIVEEKGLESSGTFWHSNGAHLPW